MSTLALVPTPSKPTPTIMLVLPKTNTGHCRSCGAIIDWYVTPAGKGMPLNVGAAPLKVTDLLDPNVGIFEASSTHWATCPHAAAWKKARN